MKSTYYNKILLLFCLIVFFAHMITLTQELMLNISGLKFDYILASFYDSNHDASMHYMMPDKTEQLNSIQSTQQFFTAQDSNQQSNTMDISQVLNPVEPVTSQSNNVESVVPQSNNVESVIPQSNDQLAASQSNDQQAASQSNDQQLAASQSNDQQLAASQLNQPDLSNLPLGDYTHNSQTNTLDLNARVIPTHNPVRTGTYTLDSSGVTDYSRSIARLGKRAYKPRKKK